MFSGVKINILHELFCFPMAVYGEAWGYSEEKSWVRKAGEKGAWLFPLLEVSPACTRQLLPFARTSTRRGPPGVHAVTSSSMLSILPILIITRNFPATDACSFICIITGRC